MNHCTTKIYETTYIKSINSLPEGSLVILTGIIISLSIKEKAILFKSLQKKQKKQAFHSYFYFF